MAFDPLKLCQPEERADSVPWYATQPAVMYPATIARIGEVIASGEMPPELVGSSNPEADPMAAAREYRLQARRLPAEAWKLAAAPAPSDPEKRRVRAEALELARKWFTRALKLAVGKSLGLHILKDPGFRL